MYYEMLRSFYELKIPIFNKSGENFTATKQKLFSCQVSTIVTMIIFDILLLDGLVFSYHLILDSSSVVFHLFFQQICTSKNH